MKKFGKKLVVILVSVMLVSLLSACSSGQDDGNNSTEPVTIKFAHYMSTVHHIHANVLVPFAEKVKEQTDGRVIIEFYPNSELGAPTTYYDQVVSGAIDMAYTLPAYTPGRFPLTSVMEFPFIFTSATQANKVAAELKDFYQENEYSDVKLLWIGGTDLSALLLKNPVDTVAGLKGLRLRSPGQIYNDVITELQGTAVSLPVSELYDSIDRGIVDGTFIAPSALIAFKLNEVVDYVVELNSYPAPLIVIMNNDTWAKISEEDQKIVQNLANEFTDLTGAEMDKEAAAAIQKSKDSGISVMKFSDAEQAKFNDIVAPLIEKWIADMEANDLPAQDTYDNIKELAETYK